MDMNSWVTPAIVIALLALGTLVFKFGSWYGNVNSDRSAFKKFMREIKKDLQTIKEDTKEGLKHSSDSAVIKDSPLRLTEPGQAISDNLNASVWASKAAESIKKSRRGFGCVCDSGIQF